MATRIKVRRGSAAEWGSVNPVLQAGEFGVETDTLKLKIGNGSTNYGELKYVDEDDNIYLGKLELPIGWATQAHFNKLCDIFGMNSHYVKHMNGEDLIVRVFDKNNCAIGSCGPGLSKEDITDYLEPLNEERPIIVKFYVKTVGDEIHSVLYNETYGAVLGGKGLKKASKKMHLDQSDFLPDVLKVIFKKLYNKTLNEYEYDNAIKCFRSVGKEKLGMFNQVGAINLGSLNPEYWWFYDKIGNTFVQYSGSFGGDNCSQIDNYFLKHGKWRKDPSSEWVVGCWLDSDPNRFPEDLVDLRSEYHDFEYESWGIACVHILAIQDTDERYVMFKIGGCGNDKLSLTIENQIHQIGLSDENYICYPYIEYYSTRRNKTLKIMDECEIDCSYPFGVIDEGCRPFKYRLRATEIEHYIKCIHRHDRGTAKFRIGIYNPELNKFSKPTRWMKIRKQYGIADIHMSFIDR